MNPVIHGQIGWLIGAHLERRRDRALVTAAALLPDLDGAGILVSEYWYAELHHRLGHGAIAAVAIPAACGLVARSPKVAALAFVAFTSHVVADLMGSGPGWPIWPYWPWSHAEWLPDWQWDLASWQNTVIGFGVILTCLSCARFYGRTPVELFHLKSDAKVVETIRRRIGPKPSAAVESAGEQ
jgi:hypothetical protein